ncbi:GGDEF domain-containing protein [Lachnospiraceae bacterium C1.1]|nr:GGDEF domain-containing protein [Lachnospiraceae bacterium C1.1]
MKLYGNKYKENFRLSALFIIIISILTLICLFLCIKLFLNGNTPNNKLVLYDGWELRINDEVYENVNLNDFKFRGIKDGDIITLRKTGIKSSIEANVLLLMIKNSTVSVRQNGETVYSYGLEQHKEGRLVGSGYHRANLHNLDEDDLIEIELIVDEKDAFSSFDPPEIRDGKTISYEMSKELLLPSLLGNFFFVFGVCIIFISLLFSAVCKLYMTDLLKIFCIALFSLCAGFWIFTSSNASTFVTVNYSVKTFLEYFSLYLMPLVVLAYQFDANLISVSSNIRKRSYILLWLADLAFITGVFVCYMSGKISVVQFLIPDHIISAIILVFIIVTQFYDIVKNKSKNYITAIGVLVLVLSGLFEVFRYNFAKYVAGRDVDYKFSVLFLAGLVFVWSIIIDYIANAVRSAKDNAKMEIIEKMAYTDSLTQIYNRMAAEKRYRKIDEEMIPYCIIEMDMNGLKRINDTYGHDEGDEYIKSFAQVLSDVFSDFAMVSRTGGDEFTVIIDGEDALDYENITKKLRELNASINYLNDIHENWNLSLAYGYCFYNEEGVEHVLDAFKKADERMYEMKKEMKKEIKKENKKLDKTNLKKKNKQARFNF